MKGFYRDVLKNAWHTTWKIKFLWFFGIFAALVANSEEYDIIVRNFDTVTNLEAKIQSLRETIQQGILAKAWENLRVFFAENIFSSLLVIFAGILVAVAIIYLIIISQAAIINAASRFRKGEKTEFFDGFVIGTKYFWPIFILNILAKLIIYGTLLILGIPLTLAYVSSGNFWWLGTLSLVAFLTLIPLNIFVSFLVRYASIYIILKEKKVGGAIKDSFELFRKNWLITIENAFILYLINFIVNFLIIAILTFTGLPFTIAGYLIFMAIIIFIGAVIATFQYSAWTNLFTQIYKGEGMSKLIRLFIRKPKEEKA